MVIGVLVLRENLKSLTVDERGLTLMCDRIKYRSNKDKTAVETAPTQTMSASADDRIKYRCSRRRLKPLLHKRCPPPRTEENNVIFTVGSSTRVGGFCLCRRGFNRRLYFGGRVLGPDISTENYAWARSNSVQLRYI